MQKVEYLNIGRRRTGRGATVAVALGRPAAGPAPTAAPGPDMIAAVTGYYRAEAGLKLANSVGTQAEMEAASKAWDAAVLAVAEELPLSPADLRAAAGVLLSVRAVERGQWSPGHDALADALIGDVAGGRLV